MIRNQDAIRAARSLLGTPYSELDCINLIKKVIRTAPGGVPGYTTAGTNSLWNSYEMSAKYRDLTWRQEGIAGARAGMIAFKRTGSDVHHAGIVTDAGTVIHSSSTQGGRGVVETPLTTAEGWNLLAIHRHIEAVDEQGEEGDVSSNAKDALFGAKVDTVSGPLNIRSAQDGPVLTRVPKGAMVDVLEAEGAWWRVRYQGVEGVAAAQYLVRISGEEDTVTISRAAAQALYAQLGSALGYEGND